MNQLDESNVDELLVQNAIDELTINIINKLRLELKPQGLIVESLRNLFLLFQNTEPWIQITNCETVPWSRLVQQLRQPKRLMFLLRSHSQYHIYPNLSKINYSLFEKEDQDSISLIINKIVCTLVQFHHNRQEITLFSDEVSIRQQVPQVSKASEQDCSINTNSSRAKEIVFMLQQQINNSKVGQYQQCFK